MFMKNERCECYRSFIIEFKYFVESCDFVCGVGDVVVFG